MSVVVINHGQLSVVHFATPLKGLGDTAVLIELVGCIGELVGQFLRRLAVAYVIVVIVVAVRSQGGRSKFATAVVGERVVAGGFRRAVVRVTGRTSASYV